MAKKTIILSRQQLDEIVGGNSAWLDNANSDFKEDALNATTVNGKIDGADGDPLTGDEFADERCLDYGPWIPGGRGGNKSTMVYTNGVLSCSKKDWTRRNVIKEESSDSLLNANVSISPTDAKEISAAGDTSVEHAINGNINQNAGRVAISRMKKAEKGAQAGDATAAQTFQNMGGQEGLNALEKTVNRNSNVNAVATGKDINNHNKKQGNNNNGILHFN